MIQPKTTDEVHAILEATKKERTWLDAHRADALKDAKKGAAWEIKRQAYMAKLGPAIMRGVVELGKGMYEKKEW